MFLFTLKFSDVLKEILMKKKMPELHHNWMTQQ